MTEKENPPLPQPSEEAMSFIDFMEVIIRKKGLVFLITTLSTLLSIGYVLSIVPVYKARIGFLPPNSIGSSLQIVPYYKVDNGFSPSQLILLPKSISVELMREINIPLYKKFLGRLRSYSHQEEVFKNGNFKEKFADVNGKPRTSESLLLELASSISLKQNIAVKNISFDKPVYLEMLGSKPEAMADFLNSLSKAAIKSVQAETLNELQRNINHLTNELNIARKLNVIENNFKYARRQTGQPMWFLFGEKALEEELSKLESVANDLSLQIKSKNLNPDNGTNANSETSNPRPSESEKFGTINLSQIKIEVATVSQPSVPPSIPVKPRKQLIISIGLLMGLFLGVLLAFISDAMENLGRRKEPS